MKIFRATAAAAFFAAISVGSISAQQPRPGTTTPTTGPAPTVNVPETKIALVNSDDFNDPKTGIVRLVNAMNRVEKEFEAKKVELQTLQQQIDKATADLAKVGPMQSAQINQQQQDKIDQMKKDFQRKGEDAQASYQKRLQEVLGPVFDEIGKALDAYAKAHGITLVLDVTKVQGIVSASDSLDITKAFITEFNSKNPATAAVTPPK
ncbi:MAG TPA: OmpH family outer membrane protein [Pyrinomonadaceae bacterium]|nr:OmpH family outer membrane protein [Pyrinomonadaceae bacterium]